MGAIKWQSWTIFSPATSATFTLAAWAWAAKRVDTQPVYLSCQPSARRAASVCFCVCGERPKTARAACCRRMRSGMCSEGASDGS